MRKPLNTVKASAKVEKLIDGKKIEVAQFGSSV
jgi:hypothetical protein